MQNHGQPGHMQREGSSLRQHIQLHIRVFFVKQRQYYSLSVFILCSQHLILENQLITINQVIKTLHVLIRQLHIIKSKEIHTKHNFQCNLFTGSAVICE